MTACLLFLSITCILPCLSEPEDQHLELVDKKSLLLPSSGDAWHHVYNPELFLLRLKSDPPAKPTDFRSDLENIKINFNDTTLLFPMTIRIMTPF